MSTGYLSGDKSYLFLKRDSENGSFEEKNLITIFFYFKLQLKSGPSEFFKEFVYLLNTAHSENGSFEEKILQLKSGLSQFFKEFVSLFNTASYYKFLFLFLNFQSVLETEDARMVFFIG